MTLILCLVPLLALLVVLRGMGALLWLGLATGWALLVMPVAAGAFPTWPAALLAVLLSGGVAWFAGPYVVLERPAAAPLAAGLALVLAFAANLVVRDVTPAQQAGLATILAGVVALGVHRGVDRRLAGMIAGFDGALLVFSGAPAVMIPALACGLAGAAALSRLALRRVRA